MCRHKIVIILKYTFNSKLQNTEIDYLTFTICELINMKLHHIGIACKDIQEGIDHIKEFYQVTSVGHLVYDELQDATLCLIETASNIAIELVTGDHTEQFLKRGISLYHTCYEVEDIHESIKEFISKGSVLVSEPKPAKLFNGRYVAFLQTPLGLIEILEATHKKAASDIKYPLVTPKSKNKIIAILSNFTASLVTPSLTFLLQQVDNQNYKIKFAPYNQVFQQLLDPESLILQNHNGINILLLKLDEWLKGQTEHTEDLEKISADLLLAIKRAKLSCKSIFIICFCPPHPQILKTPIASQFKKIEKDLERRLSKLNNVYCLSHSNIKYHYDIADYYDELNNSLAHIPYTTEYMTAIGVMLSRKITSINMKPYKVIIIDCDNTLWDGICGEQSIESLKISPIRKFIQKFLYMQYQNGMLLCLCSKNNEADIFNVFQTKKDMILKLEHITTHRINWKHKSENIESIAKELKLDTNSFIFIDDNLFECEEVKNNYPEIFTIHVPDQEKKIKYLFKNLWILDKDKITEEDKNRTSFYLENIKREAVREQFISLESFIANIALQVNLSPIAEVEFTRIAQLSKRITQFNFTSLTLHEDEIQSYLDSGTTILKINVTDRFGDYGLTGAVVYKTTKTSLIVKNILLSCRVLGRAVEYHLLNYLGKYCLSHQINTIEIEFIQTSRNVPAQAFLEKVCDIRNNTETLRKYTIDSEKAAHLKYSEHLVRSNEIVEDVIQDKPLEEKKRLCHDNIIKIANEYQTIKQIMYAIEISQQIKVRETYLNYAEPTTELEKKLANVWESTLKISPVGIYDNFFDINGDSLIATQLVVNICNSFAITLSMAEFYESPQINKLVNIIEKRLTEKNKEQIFDIHIVDRDQPIIASFAQQRIWFMDKLEPNQPHYNTFVALEMKGYIDIAVLKNAFWSLIERHESFRTSFHEEDGKVFQRVHKIDEIDFSIDVENICHLVQNDIYKIVYEEAQQPFDLQQCPLLRVRILQQCDNIHYILICLHHIINDTWSFDNFCTEFSAIYNANIEQKPFPLSPLKYQYADFAVWHTQYLQQSFIDSQMDYWKTKLADLPPLNIPTDFSRNQIELYKGQRINYQIDEATVIKLKEIAKSHETTLYTVILAIYTLLLCKHSNQDDFGVGSLVSGRHYRHIEDIIGFFANILVLRNKVNFNQTFNEFVRQCKNNFLEAQTNQDVPFEKVIEKLNPVREAGKNPLCQTIFVYVSKHSGLHLLDLKELEIKRAFSDNQSLLLADFESSKFDITLYVQEQNNQLDCLIEFNKNLYDLSSITQLIEHFKVIAADVGSHPEVPLSNVHYMSAQEQNKLLNTWNNTRAPYPEQLSIPEQFIEQAKLTPHKTAIIHHHNMVTYEQLNYLSDEYADYLIRYGVKAEDKIIILLDKCIDAIVIMLAILKISAICVPMNIKHHLKMLNNILEHSDSKFLICSKTIKGLQNLKFNVTILHMEDIAEQKITNKNSLPKFVSSAIAFLMYTSGSTGAPKGVMVPHKGILRLAKNTQVFNIVADDVFAQTSSFSFDTSFFEIWGALLNSATLVLTDDETLLSPEKFKDYLLSHSITVLWLTAALFNQIALDNPNIFGGINYLVVGGEPLNAKIVEKVIHSSSRPKYFVNGYGPTEASTFATYKIIDYVHPRAFSVQIGTPLSNTTVYVLDQALKPVPIGVPGELYIGGPGVALGYLNNPTLTAAKFIDNPFEPGTKLYKSGDLVRWLANGNLDLISRIDNLVKIKGFRLELEEIEYFILKHPKVKNVSLIVQGDDLKSIYAYVVCKDSTLTQRELNYFLKNYLPHYMLPNRFIWVEKIPLTNHGKVDKEKLLDYALHVPTSMDTLEKLNKSDTELKLLDIFSKILHISSDIVNIDDSFFDIGGHSLLVIKLLSEIKECFGVTLEVKMILESPTVAGLSFLIDKLLLHKKRQNKSHKNRFIIKLKDGDDETPLFFIHPIGGTLFPYLTLIKHLSTNHIMYGIEFPDIASVKFNYKDINELVTHYVKEMKKIHSCNKIHLIGHSFGGMLALEIADHLIKEGNQIGLLGLLDTWILTGVKHADKQELSASMVEYFNSAIEQISAINNAKSQNWLDYNIKAIRDMSFNYVPPKVDHNITLFKATSLNAVYAKIAHNENYLTDFTSHHVEVHHVSGNHESILVMPHVKKLAAMIDDCLLNNSAKRTEMTVDNFAKNDDIADSFLVSVAE